MFEIVGMPAWRDLTRQEIVFAVNMLPTMDLTESDNSRFVMVKIHARTFLVDLANQNVRGEIELPKIQSMQNIEFFYSLELGATVIGSDAYTYWLTEEDAPDPDVKESFSRISSQSNNVARRAYVGLRKYIEKKLLERPRAKVDLPTDSSVKIASGRDGNPAENATRLRETKLNSAAERFPPIPKIIVPDPNGKDVEAVQLVAGFTEDAIQEAVNSGAHYTQDAAMRALEDKILISLMKPEQPGVKLLGPSGAGKSELIRRLMLRFASGDLPDELMNYRVRTFSGASLDAGTKYVGTVESKIRAMMALSREVPILWVVDEAQTIVNAGVSEGRTSNVLQNLKSALRKGEMRMILSTTEPEWQEYFSHDTAFDGRFALVRFDPPSDQQTKVVVQEWLKRFNYAKMSDQILMKMIELSNRYSTLPTQPNRAIRFAEHLFTTRKFHKQSGPLSTSDITLTAQDFYQVDPAEFDAAVSAQTLERLEREFANIVGQDQAKQKLLIATKQIHAGVQDWTKPRYRYILAGPVGQAKTMIAMKLAKALNRPFCRILMSKYTSIHQTELLLHEIGKCVIANQFSFLFLDEYEKTPIAVQESLLSVFDYGELRYINHDNNRSQVVSLRLNNASILIATNAGGDFISKASSGVVRMGFDQNVPGANLKTMDHQDLRQALQDDGFSEAILDRMAGVLAFGYLDESLMRELVRGRAQQIRTEISEKLARPIDVINWDDFMDQITKEVLLRLESTNRSNREVDRIVDHALRVGLLPFMVSGGDAKPLKLIWTGVGFEAARANQACDQALGAKRSTPQPSRQKAKATAKKR
ncbi:MAG: AAA family ATPase [Bdellovibrionales bacterium]